MSEFIDKISKMTVAELWYEFENKPHSVVDQFIIQELIKKKQVQELMCQAQRKQKCQANRGCVGKPENNPNNIIKNNYDKGVAH